MFYPFANPFLLFIPLINVTLNNHQLPRRNCSLTRPEVVVLLAQHPSLEAPGQPGVPIAHPAGVQWDEFLLIIIILAAGLPLAPAEAADHGVGGQAVHIGDHCQPLLSRMSPLSPVATWEPKGVACS